MRLHLILLEERLVPITPTSEAVLPATQFNWTQATADGGLVQFVTVGGIETMRTRVGGGWESEPILADQYSPPPDPFPQSPVLAIQEGATARDFFIVAPDGTAHKFYASSDGSGFDGDAKLALWHWSKKPGGAWAGQANIIGGEPQPADVFARLYAVTGAADAAGNIHLVAVGYEGDRSVLRYLTNAGGNWRYENIPVPNAAGESSASSGGHYVPRFLQIAADAAGAVHISFVPEFKSENFGTVYSALHYATNRGGNWSVERVYAPPDGTGDAGLGASIAVAANGEVGMASYFTDRAPTGSPANGMLLFHRRTAAGWQTGVVADRADGYVAADGPQYTGFNPLLQYDGDTPVITFTDVAAAHLGGYAHEYSGQLRTATLTPGGWNLQTIHRQANPLSDVLYYPVRVVRNGTPSYYAVTASFVLDDRGILYDNEGTYNIIEINAPDVPFTGPWPGTDGGPAGAGVVGAGHGGGPSISVFAADGSRQFFTNAFPDGFTGGVRVASADFNRDGTPDIVAGTGPGTATRVRILDGRTQSELLNLPAFEPSFVGGVYVAAGDVTGDGIADLIITPDEGGGPRVDIYNGDGFAKVISFFGIDDPAFRGGARAAAGDIDGDGTADLVVAAGFQGGPRVAGFRGPSLVAGAPERLFGDFFAFEETLRNGVFIACGDLDGDGFAELVAGGGPGGGPRVTAFDGKNLLKNQYHTDINFFAGDDANRGGVRLAVRDIDGDGRPDLLAGSGEGAGSRVTGYSAAALLNGDTDPMRDFTAYPGFRGGVFVA
jgi:hypothetical protein